MAFIKRSFVGLILVTALAVPSLALAEGRGGLTREGEKAERLNAKGGSWHYWGSHGSLEREKTQGNGTRTIQDTYTKPSEVGGLVSMSTHKIPAGQGPFRFVTDARYAPGALQGKPGTTYSRFGGSLPHGTEIGRHGPGDRKVIVHADGSGRIVTRQAEPPKNQREAQQQQLAAKISNAKAGLNRMLGLGARH